MLGRNDLKQVAIPSTWDGAELSRLTLRDGTTYEAMLRDIDAALAALNGSLTSGYLGLLMSPTTDVELEYRAGTSTGFEVATEYSQPDAQRGSTSGHMLPLVEYDRKMGWTRKFLRDARRMQLDNDINTVIEDARNAFQQKVLSRLFQLETDTGKINGLGAIGVSVPFLDGSASVSYTPPANPARSSAAFESTHNHFLRLNGITQANLETAVKSLWEHGHDGPYELIISLADIADWSNTTNVTGYVEKADPLVQYGSDTTLARVGEEYLGGVKTKYGFCRIVAMGRVPTKYWGLTKTYGALSGMNPLRVRYDDRSVLGVSLISTAVDLYPLVGAVAEFRFGVGVGADRSKAVLVYNHTSGDYVTPTIS